MPHPVVALAFYLLVTLGVLRLAAPRSLRADRRALVLAVLLAVLLPVGQAWQHPRALYPFVDWTMYSSPAPAGHTEYVAVGADGASFLYPFSRVAFSSPWALMARFEDLIARCRCAHGDPTLDRAFRALADLHEDATGVSIVRLEAYDDWAATAPEARRPTYVWRRPHAGPAHR